MFALWRTTSNNGRNSRNSNYSQGQSFIPRIPIYFSTSFLSPIESRSSLFVKRLTMTVRLSLRIPLEIIDRVCARSRAKGGKLLISLRVLTSRSSIEISSRKWKSRRWKDQSTWTSLHLWWRIMQPCCNVSFFFDRYIGEAWLIVSRRSSLYFRVAVICSVQYGATCVSPVWHEWLIRAPVPLLGARDTRQDASLAAQEARDLFAFEFGRRAGDAFNLSIHSRVLANWCCQLLRRGTISRVILITSREFCRVALCEHFRITFLRILHGWMHDLTPLSCSCWFWLPSWGNRGGTNWGSATCPNSKIYGTFALSSRELCDSISATQ